MKPVIIIGFAILLFFGCTVGVREETLQKPDKAYLKFSGNVKGASVIVDDNASVDLAKSSNDKEFTSEELIQIVPGKHTVKVYKNNSIVVERIIFTSSGETVLIEIP